MPSHDPIQGDLQELIMRTVWKLGRSTVQGVRDNLEEADRGAYTTVQTVLNRLADRGLLSREKLANVVYYDAMISEADYLAGLLQRSLSDAPDDVRQAALINLVSSAKSRDLDVIRRATARVTRQRRE